MASSQVQITFFCDEKKAEALSQYLIETDALAVSLMDAGDHPIFEPALGETPLWPEVKVIALFDDPSLAQKTLRVLEVLLGELPFYEEEALEEKDWVSETQAKFQPIHIEKKFWIYPEWQEIPEEHQPALRLAPGLAFGTGNHETTLMCLEALSCSIQRESIVLDFGCGSGILGAASLLLGARKAYLIDIDPQALEASARNLHLNVFSEERFFLGLPEALPNIQADILVANILAQPLIALKPIFEHHLKPNGTLILAGLLENQTEEVTEAYRNWKRLKVFAQKNEWVCLLGAV